MTDNEIPETLENTGFESIFTKLASNYILAVYFSSLNLFFFPSERKMDFLSADQNVRYLKLPSAALKCFK